MLQAAIDLIDTEIPLVGINLGTLGFLSEVNRNDLETSLDQLLSDHFEIEQRMMLSGSVYSGTKQKETFQALNDIVITRRGSLQINSYNIFVNEKHLHCYHADGILVATPTGSTGYNLSWTDCESLCKADGTYTDLPAFHAEPEYCIFRRGSDPD